MGLEYMVLYTHNSQWLFDNPRVADPLEFEEFQDLISKTIVKTLPILKNTIHVIDLESGKEPPYGPIYPLFQKQLQKLREYIEENLVNGRIRYSTSPTGALILFVPKSN